MHGCPYVVLLGALNVLFVKIMPQAPTNSSQRDSSGFYIAFQLPRFDLPQQTYGSSPNHYDVFLAYTAESVPIMIGLDKVITEEGFTPWQGDLDVLIHSDQIADPYRGIHQSDAFALILDGAIAIPPDLEDELDQAKELNKLIFIVARRPLESEALNKVGLNDLKWLSVEAESGDAFKELAKIMIGSLTHVRLQARAAEWQRQAQDPKFLLSLGDVAASLERVDWLKKHLSLDLILTPEQNQFLEISQKQADKRTDYFQGKPPDIFISYSSQDRSFVKDLGGALKKADLGIWVDHDNIPIATNWKKEVAEGIRAAHTFIFVITSYSLASKHCGWELQQARRHGRRIIPICARHDFEHENLRTSGLSAINYISFERQSFSTAAEQLIKAIGTDLGDVKVFNRLYSRAHEWSSNGRQQHLLLKQEEYCEFKKWQQARQSSPNKLGDWQDLHILQAEYLSESKISIGRDLTLKRFLHIGGVVVAFALVGLTIGIAKATLGEIKALVASLNDKSGLDGVITALQASRGIEKSFLLSPISQGIQLEARTALHQETLVARELNRLAGHERAVFGITFSPNAEFIVSVGEDKTIRVWDFSGPLMPPLVKHRNEVLAVEYSSDGDFFVSGDAGGVINLWSCSEKILDRGLTEVEDLSEAALSNQKDPCQWIKALPNGPSARIVRLVISPGSQYVAAASFDGNVYLWKRTTGPDFFRLIKKFPHEGAVFGLDFSPADRMLVSADSNGNVKLWSLEENQESPPVSC